MNESKLSPRHLTWLSVLRIMIGWHFLYEGLVKVFTPDWSAYGYLMTSTGFLSGFFKALASNPTALEIVSFLNTWGLIFIGLGLFLGFLTRYACYAGILLLSLYYLCHPPFWGTAQMGPSASHYLIVDKNLIELVMLIVISLFPTGKHIGLDILIKKRKT